jgi:hypothetical protein
MIESVDQIEAAAEDQVLTLDQIDKSRDAEYLIVDVPEWGGKVRLASLSTADVEVLTERSKQGESLQGLLEMLVKSFVNMDDSHQVTDPEQIKIIAQKLLRKEAKVIERLLRAVTTLNNVTIVTPPSLEI